MIGWVQRLFGSSGGRPGPGDDFWYQAISAPAPAGHAVTVASALSVPAVYACLQVISKPIATLPLQIFRRLPKGGKEPVPAHPLSRVLGQQPNPRATAWEYRGQLAFDLGLYNNAYSEIVPGPRGPVDQLFRLDPARMKAREGAGGAIRFEYRTRDGRTRILREDQVWHLKGLPLSDDGITARPQLETARNTISAALALLDFSARFFANDTKSGGIVKHPHHFKEDEDRKRWLAAWQRAGTGVNRHKDKLLEDSMDYVKTGSTNEEAQFLETRQELWKECTNVWQVPPHKIGIFDGATKSNVAEQSLTFLMQTMLALFELFEQGISNDLIVNDELFFAEFNVAGMLRGDIKTQYEAFARGLQWGWLSINDVRGFLNMNPIRGGDQHRVPLNMAPLDEAQPGSMQQRPPGGNGDAAQAFVAAYIEQERCAAALLAAESVFAPQDPQKRGNGHAGPDA